MNWRPIEEYDAMKTKPPLCVFRFEPVLPKRPGGPGLKALYWLDRFAGNRKCTHFMQIQLAIAEDIGRVSRLR